MKEWAKIILLVLAFFELNSNAQSIYSVEVTNINSTPSDFSPFLWNNELYFCSRRKAPVKSKKESLTDGYVAKVDGDYLVSDAQLIPGLFSNFHEGPFCLTEDGQTMYFSKNYDPKIKSLKLKEFPVGIFIAKRHADGSWGEIVEFPHNNPTYAVAHPSINNDGTVIYFSSTMPGGFGGSDIYVSKLVNGEWTKPENLGNAVNSAGQEVFPVLHKSGRLYFSSNGHAGFGGLDVFFCEIINGIILPAKTMDAPVNSPADDFGFTANDDLTVGFYTSARNGKDEIFRFRLKTDMLKNMECLNFPPSDSCVTFYDTNSEGNIDNRFLKSEWRISDGTIIHGLEAKHCFKKYGTYNIDLYVTDILIGNLPELQTSATYVYNPPSAAEIQILRESIDAMAFGLKFSPVTFSISSSETYEVIWFLPNNRILNGSVVSIPSGWLVKGDTIRMIVKVRDLESQRESLYCVQTTFE